MTDRIGRIEVEIIAAHGKMLEVTWDAATGITCLLGGKMIATAQTSLELADALEEWAVASGLRAPAKTPPDKWVGSAASYESVDDPSLFLNELISSRCF